MASQNPFSNDVVKDNDTKFPTQEDVSLLHKTSSHLTRQELLQRRLSITRKLTRVYRRHFWALMDQLRAQYRLYYWKYGLSPFSNVPQTNNFSSVDNGVVVNEGNLGLGFGESGTSNFRCGFSACKLKAMALTGFCHLHILSDPHQLLYKPCIFVIKAPEQGQILCGKPILNSAVPSLCNVHSPKILKEVKQALKKAGLTAASSGRLAPKFHVVLAEYVKFIQSKRRAAKKRYNKIIVIEDESSG